jgi:hypothetical protein
MGESELLNSSQPLKPGMLNNVKYHLIGYGDKTIHRVIEDFTFV